MTTKRKELSFQLMDSLLKGLLNSDELEAFLVSNTELEEKAAAVNTALRSLSEKLTFKEIDTIENATMLYAGANLEAGVFLGLRAVLAIQDALYDPDGLAAFIREAAEQSALF